MPDLPPAMGGSFPIPNSLIDFLMPSLRDTELRVLLVVLRQTRGWPDPKTGRPKARDWLTHGRLKRHTGRASEAVSAAVDTLVRRGLIIVEDVEGRALTGPAERRRAAALYFRPGPQISSPASPTAQVAGKSEFRKAKTTKDNRDNRTCPFRKAREAQHLPANRESQEEALTAEQAASIEVTREQIRSRLASLPSPAQTRRRDGFDTADRISRPPV